MGGADSGYLDALVRTIRSEVLRAVKARTGLHDTCDEDDLGICLACDGLLAQSEDRRFSAKELAAHAACSVRQLYRAFDSLLGLSPIDYQTRVRLQCARVAMLGHPAGLDMLRRNPRKFGYANYSRLQRAYCMEYGERPDETLARKQELLQFAVKATGRRSLTSLWLQE